MARVDLPALTLWITEAALQHPDALPEQLMQRLGISRRTARRTLDRLASAQWLLREGTPRRHRYRPGALRQVARRYRLDGLQEDRPWARDFAPCFALPAPVSRLVQHAFTELINNAIEHSGGTSVTVSMRQTPLQVQLLVSDDGCGLFDRIGETFDLTEPSLAMLELSKGKLTSRPARHTGRGLFFTARLADVMDLHANASAFRHRGWEPHRWQATRAVPRRGTSVYVAISMESSRTLDAVLRQHSLDGLGYAFERTVVPLQLITAEHDALASRAQARRVGSGLQRFRRAEVDFDGIAEVGHGFVDELFRVFRREHPGIELVPTNMAPRIQALVNSACEATD
jgi:anti-sigma regulatory factor (Ser/Thr protein kinase)